MSSATFSASAHKTLASVVFGNFNRYCLKVCRTRFNTISFVVSDASVLDEFDMPEIVRIADNRHEPLPTLRG